MLIIPFFQTISDEEQDRDLHKKILANRAGVLNWIIEGAKEVIVNRSIFISAECEEFKTQFMKETDSVAMFEEYAIIDNLNGTNFYWGYVTAIYGNYKIYCAEAGYKNVLGRNNFVKRMEAIGFEKVKSREGWYLKKTFLEKRL